MWLSGSVIGGSGIASIPGSSPAASSVKQMKRSGRAVFLSTIEWSVFA